MKAGEKKDTQKRLFGITLVPIRDDPVEPQFGFSIKFLVVARPFQDRTSDDMVTNRPISAIIEKIAQNPAVIKNSKNWKLPLRAIAIGAVSLVINPATKTVITRGFYPTQTIDAVTFNRAFRNTGFGNFTELLVERFVDRTYPEFTIQSSKTPSEERRIMLEKKGRKAGETIPIRTAKRKTIEQIIALHRKNRAL